MENNYQVYMVHTSANRIYTGISTDVIRRIREHNESKKGAKILRGQRPVSFLWRSPKMSKSDALKLEAKIKKMTREQKENFLDEETKKLQERLGWKTCLKT